MERSAYCKNQMRRVYQQGLNIYALINRFKKESKLKPDIPDEVINRICKDYFKYKNDIRKQWPWFITVLKINTHQYFAQININEHQEYKKEKPMLLADILRAIMQGADRV